MLERIPSVLGRALRGVRSDATRLVYNDAALIAVPASIRLTSRAFSDRGALPARFTADGAGVSPPLAWDDAPAATAELVLLIEDPDAPMPHPLVHAVAWGLRGRSGALAEGALSKAGEHRTEVRAAALGRNSYLSREYLPPDPPPGHGTHHYAFQLFALGEPARFLTSPGRSALTEQLRAHTLAKGLLIGTYTRS